ncbi:insulinase family protein [Marinifilum breve]|uniref:Insulinase family protein n=1 Tax=Marinifilum breve TaxID=2184082 RepID=A0A2V3ZRR5_9BACT|nr:M16 family metallopeptidase [Marinifilum breve]PXX95384.1 insulinase family protein [Marinifilum breve]
MNRICIALLLLLFSIGSAIGQGNLNAPVPMNKAVRYGKLANGITYYLYHNELPKDRASFYIVQNVGALMEEDNQNGLAHFLEHMAFNGTKHFPGKGVINTLEKHGVTFGGNINAYTAKNETVYNISNVPTDINGLVDTCLLVLHDWANGLSLETEEINAERGVITEEYRQRRNAGFRIMNKIAPTLYNNSKHAKRDVIGSLDVIQNFDPATIKKFYHDWYRSDLQCIIVCGDIDVKRTEKKIQELFSQIPAVTDGKPREFYSIEDNAEPMYCVATDKEIQHTNISLYIRHKATPKEEVNHKTLRDSYVNNLYNMMVGERIGELMRNGETPFLNANINYGGLVRGYEALTLSVTPKEGKDKESVQKLFEINQDILKNGFTANEFLMAKTNMIMFMENYYKQKDKIDTETYVKECQSHYLDNIPMADIDYIYEFFNKQINTITEKEVKAKANELYADKNRAIIITGPEKEGKTYLSKEEVLDIIAAVESGKVEKQSSEAVTAKLLDVDITGGEIVETVKLKRFGAEQWTLSNGAKVIYRYCSYNPGQVAFQARSIGGKSLLDVEDLPSASVVNNIMNYGLGQHDLSTLKKILLGKQASVGVNFSELSENIDGACKNTDFESMIQMVYMLFEQPRFDQQMHDLMINRTLESIKGVEKTYGQILNDSIKMILSSYDPRVRIVDEDYINEITMAKMEEIYKERYKGADDFTFYIVGDINKKEVKKLVSKYIGAIPAANRKESFKVHPYNFPKGKTEKVLELEMAEPKAGTILTYNMLSPYSYKNIYCLDIMCQSLQLRFTEEIREKEGGTYGVHIKGSAKKYPESSVGVNIQFQCEPARVEELKGKVYDEINKVVQNGVREDDFKKAISTIRKVQSQKTKNNAYWMNILDTYILEGEDHTTKKYSLDVINNITIEDVNDFARMYFGNANLVDIIYKPKE